MIAPKKLAWQQKVRDILAFHIECIHRNKSWTLKDTARELNRSVGGISQDINLAYYMRSHPEMGELKNYVDAVEWMRAKKYALRFK